MSVNGIARPTKDQVAERLSYDPMNGAFYWIKSSRGVSVGSRAGSDHTTIKRPYCTIHIFGRTYYASHLAWLLVTGDWPTKQIDHRNGDSLDDRWDNLREATNSQNGMNKRARRNTVGGYKGIFLDKRSKTNPWVAQIKHQNIGRFATPETAARAYDRAAIEVFGEFARLNFPDNERRQ